MRENFGRIVDFTENDIKTLIEKQTSCLFFVEDVNANIRELFLSNGYKFKLIDGTFSDLPNSIEFIKD